MIQDNTSKPQKFNTLKEFYPYYLAEHQNATNRALHFTGVGLAALLFVAAMLFHEVIFFALMPVSVSVFAFIGHRYFEKNKPSTFKYPLWTLIGDFALFGDLIMGKQKFNIHQ